MITPDFADAGCGCQKPPPPPAEVRPRAAYSTTPITLFSPALIKGSTYAVTFAPMQGTPITVEAAAVARRDLADGATKLQLVVPLPVLPLGPANVVVTGPDGAPNEVLFIEDADFTVIADPVPVPSQAGKYRVPDFQAAVGRDGTVYIALDMSGAVAPRIFDAFAAGYPLRFNSDDVVFLNAQGYLMQLLVASSTQKKGRKDAAMPGMFILPAVDPTIASDQIHYSRHEFATYFLQHAERQAHAVDSTDPNWHVDGSPHIDHDHLVLAIAGHLGDGRSPAPGSTPGFDLNLSVYSLFSQGLVGRKEVSLADSAQTDSFISGQSMSGGRNGDVLTHGMLTLSKNAVVNGNATASQFTIKDGARLNGTLTVLSRPQTLMEVKMPSGLTDLGSINVSNGVRSIVGPGSFRVSSLTVGRGGRLFVDDSAGPVTLYVKGAVTLTDGGRIDVADPDPEKFAIYATESAPLVLTGAGTRFAGVVYAPESDVVIRGTGDFSGSFVGDAVKLDDNARVHFDEALRGD